MPEIIIIGGGPGGYETAVKAAAKGCSVHLFDHVSHLGGTCLHEGCIPTKSLCHAASVWKTAKEAACFGATAPDNAAFRMDEAQQQKQGVIEALHKGIQQLLKNPLITLHDTYATLNPNDAHEVVTAEGERFRADYVIIATGSQPRTLPIPGADHPDILTSTSILQLTAVPESLCIIGGGVIGLEFAGIFSALGTKVTVVEYAKEILPNFDRDLAKRLRTAMKRQGVEFVTGAAVTAIHREEETGAWHVSYEYRNAVKDAVSQQVLMAVGRSQRLDVLGAGVAGLEATPRGIQVDDCMQTTLPGVYAIGDVNGLCPLAHAATRQGERALAHILAETPEQMPPLSPVPAAVFTEPEAAMVGLTEEQATEVCADAKVYKAFYRANGRALTMQAGADGVVKVIADAEGHVLGAHLLGAHAAELVHEVALLMTNHGTLADLCRTIHAHPALSEIVAAACANGL